MHVGQRESLYTFILFRCMQSLYIIYIADIKDNDIICVNLTNKVKWLYTSPGSASASQAAASSSGTHMEHDRQQPIKRFRMQWDLLFWMLASFTTLYLSEFASNLLLNDNVKRYV